MATGTKTAAQHERHIMGWAAAMSFTQLAWLIAALMILAEDAPNVVVFVVWIPLMLMTLIVLPVWAVNGLDH